MEAQQRRDPATGERHVSVDQLGRALLLDPLLNKGTAFSHEERDRLALHGFLPPAVSSLEQQLVRTYENFRATPTPLAKYVHLAALQDRNEVLFYRLLHEHIEEMMPIVYTPTVGEACQRWSHIYRRPRGLYLDWELRGRLAEVLAAARVASPSVIVVTDGERILGLGDQGAGGMGIPVGKLSLYTLCAGIPPDTTLPILLDVGTDNASALDDPLYLGLRRKRIRGAEYQSFVDEFVAAVRAVWPAAILQWEDFFKENALTQLARFRNQLPTFNDDIQGTAAVALSGLLASLRLTGTPLVEQRLMIAGAGASAQGIAELFVAGLVEAGLAEPEARARVYMVDRHGLVVGGRAGLEGFKLRFARAPEESAATLLEALERARPTMLVGTSATPGLFDEAVVRAMARNHERPVIFPLSNPTPSAECTPADALRWSDGRALLATGSPFEPVDVRGRRVRIGQCNNSFVFPGLGLGAWVGRVRRISDEMFLDAAHALAATVTEADLDSGSLFPALTRIRDVSRVVACAVIRRAVRQGHAEPALLAGLEDRVRAAMWFPEYAEIRYEPR
jgi:malic enzyme